MNFEEYLKSKGQADRTISNYVFSLSKVEKILKQHLNLNIQILNIKDISEFKKIKLNLEQLPEYTKSNINSHNQISSALSNYLEYLQYIAENINKESIIM